MKKTLFIGMKEKVTKTITDLNVKEFINISGDLNPVHSDEEYAQKTIFKKRVVPGMLTASLISGVLGTKLPGEGTIYLEQNLKFIKPVYINDIITTEVEIENIEGKIITILTKCYNQKNELLISGQAKVLY